MSAFFCGDATLPDGRKVEAIIYVKPDGPGDIWEVIDFEMAWVSDGGRELTEDEYNAEIEVDAETYPTGAYLHEYVTDVIFATGTFDENYPEPLL